MVVSGPVADSEIQRQLRQQLWHLFPTLRPTVQLKEFV
jgi:hypothetical protein